MAQTQNIMTKANIAKTALLAAAVIALSATQSLADGKEGNDQSATNAQVQALEKRIAELERKSGNTARTLELHNARFKNKAKISELEALQIQLINLGLTDPKKTNSIHKRIEKLELGENLVKTIATTIRMMLTGNNADKSLIASLKGKPGSAGPAGPQGSAGTGFNLTLLTTLSNPPDPTTGRPVSKSERYVKENARSSGIGLLIEVQNTTTGITKKFVAWFDMLREHITTDPNGNGVYTGNIPQRAPYSQKISRWYVDRDGNPNGQIIKVRIVDNHRTPQGYRNNREYGVSPINQLIVDVKFSGSSGTVKVYMIGI